MRNVLFATAKSASIATVKIVLVRFVTFRR